MGVRRRHGVESRLSPTHSSAPSTRSPRRSTATGSCIPTETPDESTWATSTSTGASFYEVHEPAGGLRSAAADGGSRRLDRDDRPGPRPRADAAMSGTPRWRRPDDDLGELSGRRPQRRARGDQRAPFGVLSDRASHRLHHGARLRAGACGQSVDSPTADQPGLIGPNWAKGWIIEDNVIHDAKCSAISLGKEASTGDNYATLRRDKPGYQYQLESVFSARQIGWDREHVGSHIVRRNTIYDCGQNGIVGHLGCVFSTIEDNHIYNIALKREFYGYEIAGIKLHAAHRRRHPPQPHPRLLAGHLARLADAGHPRLPKPLLRQQPRPLRRGQPRALPRRAQRLRLAGVAGVVQPGRRLRQQPRLRHGRRCEPVVERPTPYHVPHSTQVAGYAAILGGDDRYIGNIFLGGDASPAYGPTARVGAETAGYGTAGYDGHPASLADYLALVDDPSRGDHERFMGVKQPVYIHDNVYASGAGAYEAETGRRRPRRRRREHRRCRRGRRGLPRDAAAGGVRPGAHRTRHRQPTSSGSASWTRTSRNAMGARRGSTPT